MVVLHMIDEEEFDVVDARARIEERENGFQRIRPIKLARAPGRKRTKVSSPGSIRLRRNKHWSW
jgi:hypothetical protein